MGWRPYSDDSPTIYINPTPQEYLTRASPKIFIGRFAGQVPPQKSTRKGHNHKRYTFSLCLAAPLALCLVFMLPASHTLLPKQVGAPSVGKGIPGHSYFMKRLRFTSAISKSSSGRAKSTPSSPENTIAETSKALSRQMLGSSEKVSVSFQRQEEGQRGGQSCELWRFTL